MTIQDDLILTVLQAKCTVANWASDMVNKERYGSDISCCEKKMFLMLEWIRILEFYNCENFDANGNITPDIDCLSQAQMLEILAKIRALIKCGC